MSSRARDTGWTRRKVLSGLVGAVTLSSEAAGQRVPSDHDSRVSPARPVPDIPVTCDDGQTAALVSLLKEHVTALQLVFTECTTTCPIQAATFAQVQELIPDQARRSIQLLSLSIDPAVDTPAALHAWLKRAHARAGWAAVAPRMEDLTVIRAFFGDGARPVSNHGTRVHIINPRAELVWRTLEMPSAESIAITLRKASGEVH